MVDPTFDVLADDLDTSSSVGEPVVAPPPAPAPSPSELARRLADQAKQNLATARPEKKQEDRMAQEDPRELARRLAEQAKNRMKAPPEPVRAAPEPFDDDPPEQDDDGPAITMAPTRPAAERAATTRPMSALEALAAAREAEKRRSSESDARDSRAAEARPAERSPAPAERAAAPRPVSVAPIAPARAAAVIGELFPNAVVEVPAPVGSPDVFRALWRAHRARAVHDGDTALAVTASVLLDAAGRVPAPNLVACRVTLGERRFAAWVDLERGALLGMASPADVFLTG